MSKPISIEEIEKMTKERVIYPDAKHEGAVPSREEIKEALSIQVDTDLGSITEVKLTLWWHDELISEANIYI